MSLFKKEISFMTVLAIFGTCLFLTGLGKMALTDPDEVFYAETAKEMLKRGEFLTPYIFGQPQFEKPPIYYWLVEVSFKAFGVNEFAARFPSALFGVMGMIGVYFLGKLFFTGRAGFIAGILLATSAHYIVLARACVTDMVLSVFILYAFLFFFLGYFNETGKTKWYLLSSVFLALAVMTKGPIGVLLPGIIILLYLIVTKELKKLKEIPFLGGILLFLAVALPWYILMYRAHGKEFIDVFFGFHNVVRFLKPEHEWGDIFYYYFPVILLGFAPWTLFLPLSIWQARREGETKIKKANLFLLIWFFVIVAFFSFSRTKLPTYIFPLYPALALSVGRLADAFIEKNITKRLEIAMDIFLYIFFVGIIVAMAALYIAVKMRYPAVATITLAAAVIFAPLMAFFVAKLIKRKFIQALVIFMLSFIFFTTPFAHVITPEIARYESSKDISEKVLTLMKPGEELGAETHYRRGVAFYTGVENIPDVHRHHIITSFLSRKERVWCIIKDKNHMLLYAERASPSQNPYGKPTYVVYQLGKKVIVTNNIPEDGKFLKKRSKNEPY